MKAYTIVMWLGKSEVEYQAFVIALDQEDAKLLLEQELRSDGWDQEDLNIDFWEFKENPANIRGVCEVVGGF